MFDPKAYARDRRANRRAAGLCADCPDDPPPPPAAEGRGGRCDACADRVAARGRASRRAQGIPARPSPRHPPAEVLAAVERLGSQTAAAKSLGISHQAVSFAVKRAREQSVDPDPWIRLDPDRPSYHLRALARGEAPVVDPRRAAALGIRPGDLAPVLTLPEAAELLGCTMSTVHTAERAELGLVPRVRGSITLERLRRLADAYGVDLEIRVRARRPARR